MRRKDAEREAARDLRRDGLSVKAIAERLSVSPSSVSTWVRDVVLTPEQARSLREAAALGDAQRLGAAARSRQSRETRAAAQRAGREMARVGDPLHQAGCMLFWAEGSRSRNSVRFTNSDVQMHRFFLRFLRECYAVEPAAVALTINCHLGNGLALEDIEAWWLAALELPAASLRRSVVNRPSSASKGVHRPLVHGTAQLAVDSTELAQSLYGAIQAYAGFDRPQWLDLAHPSRPLAPSQREW